MNETSQCENHRGEAAALRAARADLRTGCSYCSASPCSGFALVAVLLFLAILLGGVAVLASFVSLSQRSGVSQRNADSAKQSALYGLNIAMGELQAAAGPDQRVTAPASILGNPTYTEDLPSVAGQAAWTGVWKSNVDTAPNGDPAQFNPAEPDRKAFIGWLVSATDASGAFAIPTALSAWKLNSTLNAGQTRTLFTNIDGTPYIQAGKVQIDDVPGGKRYFAFAVEDEGVKADLAWSETPAAATTGERAQASRLSAAPGPDYAALNGTNGPFSSLTYPLTIASPSFLSTAIAPMRDPADLQVSMNATTTWLNEQRANITWGSMGVLSDVKKGGLRRDLSLAFEMDGMADVTATSKPTKFNQQDGEFVGGNDRLTAPQAAQGMGGVKERFLYRDFQGSGTPFSGDITTASSVVRGPNWWALRDYANLYKRLSGSGGNYTLTARSYYPNVSAKDVNYTLGKATGPNSGANNWDKEINNGTQTSGETYIFRPAKSNYAPVLLGSVCLFSAIATESNGTTAKLGLGIDPFFYLWNPYNRTLKVDKFAVHIRYGFPGHVTFYVTQGGTRKRYGPRPIREYLAVYATGATQDHRPLTYLVSNLTMAPGEVMVVSPSSSRSASADAFNDEATPGTNTDNASGVILTKIPDANVGNTAISWQEVPLNLGTDTVEFTYSNQLQATDQVGGVTGGTELFWLHTYLPAPNTTAKDLANNSTLGEELMAIDNNTMGSNAISEYYYPDPEQNQLVPPVGPFTARTLENTKNFFGIVSYLAKPASFSGNNPNPVEVFSQFNPAPIGNTYNDLWRPSQLNQIYNMVSRAGGANTLLQKIGINFPAFALNNGFWGQSYSSGSTNVPMSNIPSAPIFSLASFSHAALSVRTAEPYHAVGNSWANLFVSPVSTYGRKSDGSGVSTTSDSSWLLNDALFDRYYLSGIAPTFTIGGGGYSATGTIPDTLASFFSADYTTALANPVLRPYLPPGQTAAAVTAALAADDGYKKLGAYSLIAGAFNVNSTSVAAWTAFLRANRDLSISYAQSGGSEGSSGSPFPSSTSPVAPGSGAASLWSGFSRINDAQVATLAAEIVKQVKLRGPFMSLSDFINHRVGTPKTTESYMGALQAAIEAANINSVVQTGAGGVTPVYSGAIATYFPDPLPIGNRTTTTGIPTDITQADLLLPLAPRLAARSDTFRIRSYGEVRSTDGTKVISQATCEAIVQRMPEYMDPASDAANNEPWDEGTGLNATNKTLGRRFKVVSFRWLNPNEI